MRNLAALLIAGLLAYGCGTPEADQAAPPAVPAESTDTAPDGHDSSVADENGGADSEAAGDLEAIGDVEVDRNLLSVEVTIPPDFVDGADPDTIRAEAQEQGIRDVTFNDDGSVTYKMSRSQHRQMMTELRTDISDGLAELPDDFPSIQQVEHDRGFTQFTLTVDRNGWENSFDGFATLAIAMGAGFYHIFDGTNPDDLQMTIDIVDADTGDTFDTVVLPDDWDD